MAGREQSGPLAAQGDLFRGRPWVLTPTAQTGEPTVRRVRELAELCGARPLVMAHAAHDRAVALTSHAPHVVASLVAARLLDGDASQLQLAGQGLRDMTRIAGGDAELWTDILGSNATAVAEVLAEVALDLGTLVDALRDMGAASPAVPPERYGSSRAHLASALVRGVRGRGLIPGVASGEPRLTGVAAGT